MYYWLAMAIAKIPTLTASVSLGQTFTIWHILRPDLAVDYLKKDRLYQLFKQGRVTKCVPGMLFWSSPDVRLFFARRHKSFVDNYYSICYKYLQNALSDF